MTPTAYFIAIIAKSFGYERRSKRMLEASAEMGLLREAELQLGMRIWERIEPVEELAVEYWNLRKLSKDLLQYQTTMDDLNKSLQDLHTERSAILNHVSEEQTQIEQQRVDLLLSLETLANEKDEIVRRAKDIRRSHEGLLTKIEVIQRDALHEEEITIANKTIEQLKEEFKELKIRRQQVAQELEDGDRTVDELDSKLNAFRQEKRDLAAIVFQKTGEINRLLSINRGEVGILETQIRLLQSEIGRYVSRYSKRNPACAKIITGEQTMVEVMRMLRMSISMNHKLADFK
jgi:chromosome segregation ATPase